MKRSVKMPGVALGATLALVVGVPGSALACGCFTPPDPSVPVVQAGERIVFAMQSGKVTAHIQIQYSGDAKEFGWLLPLPSVPVMELGSDELFTQITAATQPKYRLVYQRTCGGGGFGANRTSPSAASDGEFANGGSSNPLVVQDSIGPYDYAVLKADSQQAMLDWLKTNRYFVPAGTDAAIVPYVHPGAFFLALKLRSGKSTGDLQPVVVRYASDLPMIPIVLTSTAAQPDMGIQVWLLGQGRGIPRNYFHTVLNDAAIDWANAGANYNDLVIRATKEAEGRHTFVTEYAGSASVMKGVLDPPGRFGNQAELGALADPVQFVAYLRDNGFGLAASNTGGLPSFGYPVFSGALLAILQASIPYPAGLAAQGVTAAQFYAQLDYYLGAGFRAQNPSLFQGLSYVIDPKAMAAEIWKRVVEPTLNAASLFSAPYLTRLYTTLSPAQMDRDPVFSFNPSLPEVSNVHQATAVQHCTIGGSVDGTTITTEQGYKIEIRGSQNPTPPTGVPASSRIEVLREDLAPQVVTDNAASIRHLLGQDGCSVAPGAASRGGLAGMALLAGAVALLGRRRRRTG